ncbi:MAG: aminotransferase class I/II-fold pyridoxal phosphate-dependent enzyme, partial [Bryobacteraceae bacterium]
MALQVPNYMQLWGVPRSLGAEVTTFPLRGDAGWEPDWDAFERAVTANTRLLYVSNPNNPSGSVLSESAMRRMVEHCEKTKTFLLADEVYLGAEINRPRTKSFWGMSDIVILTSGLSKAYGIPGVRIGWIIGPKDFIAKCWEQHDYLTIGPNKMSDRIALTAVTQRDACYARTGAVLAKNIELIREWVASFDGFLSWQEPAAGAIGLVHYNHAIPSIELADRIRERQSVLVVPGSHVGLEGYMRVWFGGKEAYLREGLRRIAIELNALRA